MPVYDYRCDHCGHVFTAFQAMSEDPLARCPKCGQRPRRVPSSPAIVFKGSGWHVNDYRSKKDKEFRSKDGDASKSDTGAKQETKSPAKPETKASD